MANIDEKMKVKRMRYFNSLFLTEEEFNLEQNYNIRMRRLHNRHLHTWGIVWGLGVVVEGENKVKIIRGMALNKAEGTKTEGNDGEDISQEVVLTEDTIHVLESDDIISGVYIYLDFEKVDNYVLEERGGTEKIHWLEEAVIGHSTDIDQINEDGGLVLAKVQKDESDNISIKYFDGDTSLRTYAGAYGNLTLPIEKEAPEETQNQPRIEGKKIEGQDGIQISSQITKFSGTQTDQPASLSIEGGLHVGGTADPGDNNLKVDGNCTIDGTLGVKSNVEIGETDLHASLSIEGGLHVGGTSDPGDNNLIVDGNCSIGGTVEATEYFGDGSNLTGISPGQWTDFSPVGIYYKENVGIGTVPTEKDKLTIEGVVRARELISDGLTVQGAVSAKEFRGGMFFGDGSNLTDIPGQWTDFSPVGIYYKENVGIGVEPSTADKLTVDGVVRAIEFIGDGLTVQGAVSAKEFRGGMFFGDGSNLTDIPGQWTDVTNVGIYYKENVGIGVEPSTADKLTVEGVVRAIEFIGDGLTVQGAVSAKEFRGGMFFGDGSNLTDIKGQWTDFPPLGISYLENVGIGTKPTEDKLTVQGAVRALEFIGDGSQLKGTFPRIYDVPLLQQTIYGRAVPVESFKTGKRPVAVTFDGAFLWVTNYTDNNVSKIDIYNRIPTETYTNFNRPWGIAFDGSHIWVTNFSGAELTRIDIADSLVTVPISGIPNPKEIVYDGKYLWVTSLNVIDKKLNIINKIDIATSSIEWSTKLIGQAYSVAFDGRNIWVANPILEGSDYTVSKIINGDIPEVEYIKVGGSPRCVAFDGKHIWATILPNIVQKIDINTDEVVQTVIVGQNPTQIAFDGRFIWISNQKDSTVSKIDINSTGPDPVVATVNVEFTPRGIAFDGRHIWVANSNSDNTNNRVTKI